MRKFLDRFNRACAGKNRRLRSKWFYQWHSVVCNYFGRTDMWSVFHDPRVLSTRNGLPSSLTRKWTEFF